MFIDLQLAWRRWDTARRVRRHGWTGIYVGDYKTAPTWAYTVGFDETLNQPEVIVFDLPQRAANDLLWAVYEDLKSATLVLEDGATCAGATSPCVWRKVDPSQINGEEGWLTLACQHRWKRTGQWRGLEAFQLVLSDDEGRLPWDEGYDERLRPLQPALWLPAEDAPTRTSASPDWR